jgi:hypothetical protein
MEQSAPTTTIGNAEAALALADSSSADTQTTQTPSVESTAAATVQPDGQETPAATETPTPGEPPKWRWQDILANARETSAKEAETRARQELEQQYGWAKDVAEHERQGLLTWRAAMNGDPQALAHLKANPQVVTWLKGLMEPAQTAPDPEPEPDLQTADGTPVYSAMRQREWREWNNRQLTGTFEQKLQKALQPLQTVAHTFQSRESEAAYNTTVSGVIAKMEAADPTFKTHRKDVADLIMNDPKLRTMALGDGQQSADPETALEIAWSRVYRAKVLPGQQQQSEAQVISTLQQRAVAATTNPASATSATPKSMLGDARAALEHAYAVVGKE